jgi:hypothetical protein
VDNIKINLREIEWYDMNWINLAEDRALWRALVNTVIQVIQISVTISHDTE